MKALMGNREGFTLIELIVSIAILAIIIIAFMPLFSFSFVNTFRSGNQSEAVYQNQSLLEESYSGAEAVEGVTSTELPQPLEINIDGVIVRVPGRLIEVTSDYDKNGSRVETKAFVPKE